MTLVGRSIRTAAVALAFMAILASGAAAATYQATSYPYKALGSQVGEHTFTIDGQTVKCSTATFESAKTGGAMNTLEVFATYAGCKAFGFVNATVNMQSCSFRLEEPSGENTEWFSSVSVRCSGNPIEINATTAFGTCEVRVGTQTASGGNSYTIIGSGTSRTLEIKTSATGIKANVLKDTGICPLAGAGIRENATYIGTTTADSDIVGEGIFIDPTEPPPGYFQASSYPVVASITELGDHTIALGGQIAKCSEVDLLSDEYEAATAELRVSGSYANCKAFGFTGATVQMNACRFVFEAPLSDGPGWSGAVAIECPAEASIEVKGGSAFGACEVRIGSQAAAGGNYYVNEEDGTVTIGTNLSGLEFDVVKDTGICPFSGTGEEAGATYVGESSAEGGQELFIDPNIPMPGVYSAAGYPVQVESAQVGQHVFVVDGQSIQCKTADFVSPSYGASTSTLSVYPTYEGCSGLVIAPLSTVNMNSCYFLLDQPIGAGSVWTSSVDVKCTSSSVIEINSSSAFGSCEVRIGDQSPSGGNEYLIDANGSVWVDSQVSGITANVVKDTGVCPLSGTGPRTNATYTGDSSAEGGSGQDIFIE